MDQRRTEKNPHHKEFPLSRQQAALTSALKGSLAGVNRSKDDHGGFASFAVDAALFQMQNG